MRIKVIGECESARALRGLLKLGGLAVVNVLPGDGGVKPPLHGGLVISLEESAPGLDIHFDSVDSDLERLVLKHVTQLTARPVRVDRQGGQVHSDRELRIVVPAQERERIAVEYGVLRGLLEMMGPQKPWYKRMFGGGE